MKSKTVRLGWELMEIEQAVVGVRILLDNFRHQQFGNDFDGNAAPHAASAMLSMVVLRLQRVWHVVQGETNPAEIWSQHNAIEMSARQQPADDVYLTEWTAERTLGKTEAALGRARAAIKRQSYKPRRKVKR